MKKEILLVGDDKPRLSKYSRVLVEAGYKVLHSTKKAALETTNQSKPEWVIVDAAALTGASSLVERLRAALRSGENVIILSSTMPEESLLAKVEGKLRDLDSDAPISASESAIEPPEPWPSPGSDSPEASE